MGKTASEQVEVQGCPKCHSSLVPGWLSKLDAAAMLGCSEKHVDKWYRARLNPSTDEVRVGRKLMLRASALLDIELNKKTVKLQEQLSVQDPELQALLGGDNSDALEEVRKETAIKLRMANEERRGETINVMVLRTAFTEAMQVQRSAAERIQKVCGEEGLEIYNESLAAAEAAVMRVLVDASGEDEVMEDVV